MRKVLKEGFAQGPTSLFFGPIYISVSQYPQNGCFESAIKAKVVQFAYMIPRGVTISQVLGLPRVPGLCRLMLTPD